MATLGAGFVGREAELAALGDAVTGALSGHGGLVVVTGEAGMGKSRLCEEVVAHCRAQGVGVAWAACWQSGGLPAFWPWSQLLTQLGATFPRSVARTLEPGVVDARVALFEEVADVLREVSAGTPRVLVLDDLHWADDATLRLLAYLAPLLRTMAVVVIAAVRAGEPGSAPLTEVERHARMVRLPGLPAEDVETLITSVTGEEPTASVAAAVREITEGNPLFVTDLVSHLKAGRGLNVLTLDEPVSVPPTVRAMVSVRLDRVSRPCRGLLTMAAVIGDEFDRDLVAEVAGVSVNEALGLIEEATRVSVLHSVGAGRHAFMHPLLRAVLYEDLGAVPRARTHERVGLALEAALAGGRAVDRAALSHHFLAAASGSTAQRAVRYAIAAAHEAMAMMAYRDAATLYERALDALDVTPSAGDRISTLLALGAARSADGRPSSREALLEASGLARTQARPADLAAAALGLAGGSGFEVGLYDDTQVALLEEALAALDDGSPALRSLCCSRLSVALSARGDLPHRVALSDAAVALARASGDRHALAHALASSCDVHAGPADTGRRLRDADEIITLARAAGDRSAQLLGRRLRLVALLEAGDLGAADSEVALFARVADEVRQPVYRWYVPLWWGTLSAARGDLAGSRVYAREAAAIGATANSPNAEILVFANTFFLHREAGEFGAASALLDEFRGTTAVAELGIGAAGVTALDLATTGRPDEAASILDRCTRDLAGVPLDSEWLPLMVELAEATWELGGHPLASWLYDALAPSHRSWAVEGIGAYAHGSVARHLGLLAALLGRPDTAAEHFEAALAANRAAGATLLAARTNRDWGVALGDRARLEAALAAYRGLDVPSRLAEVEAALGPSATPIVAPATGARDILRREGEVWALDYAGRVARVRDTKGMRDLARLIAQPRTQFAAVDLAASPGTADGVPESLHAPGDLGEVIDARAGAAYRARLVELQGDIDEADEAGDAGRSERLVSERDSLLHQLAQAYGLGGRPRRAGDPAERARTAVTARIRDAVRRIDAVHPELGRHLARSVRTGRLCVYDP